MYNYSMTLPRRRWVSPSHAFDSARAEETKAFSRSSQERWHVLVLVQELLPEDGHPYHPFLLCPFRLLLLLPADSLSVPPTYLCWQSIGSNRSVSVFYPWAIVHDQEGMEDDVCVLFLELFFDIHRECMWVRKRGEMRWESTEEKKVEMIKRKGRAGVKVNKSKPQILFFQGAKGWLSGWKELNDRTSGSQKMGTKIKLFFPPYRLLPFIFSSFSLWTCSQLTLALTDGSMGPMGLWSTYTSLVA